MDQPGLDLSLGLFLLAAALILAVAVAATVWIYRRSAALLQRWAEQNGYHVVASERRLLRRGPFSWTTGRGQVVFYVTVRDTTTGQMHSGWVRCGSFWLGLLSDKTEVRWDESANPYQAP